MLKKIVVGALMAVFIGALVFGAVNRTLARTENTAQAQGRGAGGDGYAEASGGRGGNGQGGRSNSQDVTNAAVNADLETYQGIIAESLEDGGELVVETTGGELLTVGTGPSYLAAQGFALQVGDRIELQGFWEDGEFKAVQITRSSDGQTIRLRDEYGRPAWAGGGRNNNEAAAPSGDQAGAGQAEVDAWISVQGSISAIDVDGLVIQTVDGHEIIVEGRAWSFAQELGFWAQVDDQVTLTGFYEGEDFEVAHIEDTTNRQSVLLRDENGRPNWAGRGRRGA
jgi:hypothetical protein